MTNAEFGLLVKKLREEQGMTQVELAKKLGYKSKSSINKIELGLQDMPRPKLLKLAEVLHTPVQNFIGDSENDGVRKQLYDIIDSLPEDRLEKILRIVQAVTE